MTKQSPSFLIPKETGLSNVEICPPYFTAEGAQRRGNLDLPVIARNEMTKQSPSFLIPKETGLSNVEIGPTYIRSCVILWFNQGIQYLSNRVLS
jgi:hypothetical protein